MLEKSLGLLFYLKKPKNYNRGPIPIYLRITVDGDEKELSTKRSWEQSRWNVKANRATGTKEDARSLNDYLDVLQNKAYDIRKQLIEKGKVVTAIGIRSFLSGAEQRQWMLMVLFKQHNDELEKMIGKGVAQGTLTNFNTSYRHVLAFLQVQYSVSDINILSLDLNFVNKLYKWLRTEKNLGHNSALKNISNLNKIVLSCVDNGWLVSDPFIKFENTRDEVETIYLSKDELQAIADKCIMNSRLSRVSAKYSSQSGTSTLSMLVYNRIDNSILAGDAFNMSLHFSSPHNFAITCWAFPNLKFSSLILKSSTSKSILKNLGSYSYTLRRSLGPNEEVWVLKSL